jgi:hypothetical protein
MRYGYEELIDNVIDFDEEAVDCDDCVVLHEKKANVLLITL